MRNGVTRVAPGDVTGLARATHSVLLPLSVVDKTAADDPSSGTISIVQSLRLFLLGECRINWCLAWPWLRDPVSKLLLSRWR